MSDLIQGIYKHFTRDSESDLTDDLVNGLQQREIGYNRGRQWLTYRDTDDSLKHFGITFHYDSRSFTSFANAITTIGSENCTLVVSQQEAISTNVTVPANVHVFLTGAGSFDIAITKTLTINGQLTAPTRKIFNGSGTAVIGAISGNDAPQQFWGGDVDSIFQIGQTKVSNSRYYSLAIDESDSSKFKISYSATGAAPGTNDYLSIDISGAVRVYNGLTVSGAGTFSTTLHVVGATTLDSTLGVTGASSLSTLSTSGLATLNSLTVTGAATLSSTLNVVGNFSVNTNKFTVAAASGNTLVAGTLDATGNFAVNTNKFTVAASSGNTLIAGTLDSTGNFAVATSKFTVAAASGNTLVAGTLDSTGNFSINTNKFTVAASSGNTVVAGTLGVTGTSALTGTVGIGVSPSTAQALKVQNSALAGTSQYGIAQNSSFTSASTVAGYGIYTSLVTAASSFTMTNGFALYIDSPSIGAGSAVTSMYGLNIQDITGGTNNYAIRTGLGVVRFGDIVSIGGASNASYALQVQSPVLTGVSQYGIVCQMTATSAATTQSTSIYANARTAAASFTCTTAIGVQVDDASKGASSTITTLYGLKVENQTQGGTNYAIKTGAGQVSFGDRIWMGTADAGSAVAFNIGTPTTPLTSTSQYGLAAQTVFNSSATGAGRAVYAAAATAASSFTCTDLMGIQVESGSKGASSTITNNYGIKINDQNVSGATNYAIKTGLGKVSFGDLVTINSASPSSGLKLSVMNDDGVVSGEHFCVEFGRSTSSGQFLIGYRADGANATGCLLRGANSLPIFIGTSGSNQAITIANSGAVTFAGALTFSGALTSAGTSGGYDEGTWTAAFNSGWSGTQNSAAKYTRVGKLVTIKLTAFNATSNSASFSTAASNIPGSITPSTDTYCACEAYDNGTPRPSMIKIGLDGSLSVISAAGLGITGSGTKGLVHDICVSYIIN